MQTSQEELRSTNQELQLTNEELQTVNHELQLKLDDLSRSNSDMQNLLNSTDIATLFLDENLRIRRYTNHAAPMINLIASDTGRPITDIASELIYPDLQKTIQEVLRSLVFSEKTVSTRAGRWFLVRIMPSEKLLLPCLPAG